MPQKEVLRSESRQSRLAADVIAVAMHIASMGPIFKTHLHPITPAHPHHTKQSKHKDIHLPGHLRPLLAADARVSSNSSEVSQQSQPPGSFLAQDPKWQLETSLHSATAIAVGPHKMFPVGDPHPQLYTCLLPLSAPPGILMPLPPSFQSWNLPQYIVII